MTVAAPEPPSTLPDHQNESDSYYNYLKSQNATFFFRLERELDKVNGFYVQRQAEMRQRLESLLEKKSRLDIRRAQCNCTAMYAALEEAFMQLQQDVNKLQVIFLF